MSHKKEIEKAVLKSFNEKILIVCAEHCLKMNDVIVSKSELDCLKNCKGKTQTLTKVTKEILERHGLAGKAL